MAILSCKPKLDHNPSWVWLSVQAPVAFLLPVAPFVLASFIPRQSKSTTTPNPPKPKASKLPTGITSQPNISSCIFSNVSVEALKISAVSPSFPKIFSTTARLRCDICASGCARPSVCPRNVQALWCNAAASGKRPNFAKTLAKLFMEATVSLESSNSKIQVPSTSNYLRINRTPWKHTGKRLWKHMEFFNKSGGNWTGVRSSSMPEGSKKDGWNVMRLNTVEICFIVFFSCFSLVLCRSSWGNTLMVLLCDWSPDIDKLSLHPAAKGTTSIYKCFLEGQGQNYFKVGSHWSRQCGEGAYQGKNIEYLKLNACWLWNIKYGSCSTSHSYQQPKSYHMQKMMWKRWQQKEINN